MSPSCFSLSLTNLPTPTSRLRSGACCCRKPSQSPRLGAGPPLGSHSCPCFLHYDTSALPFQPGRPGSYSRCTSAPGTAPGMVLSVCEMNASSRRTIVLRSGDLVSGHTRSSICCVLSCKPFFCSLSKPPDQALGSKGHSLPAEPICHLSVSPSEECELGAWGSWSPCTHNGKTCGSAWGLETRVRQAGRAGQEEGATCQVLSESRKCPLQRPCPGGKDQARHAGPPWAGPGVMPSGLGTLVL